MTSSLLSPVAASRPPSIVASDARVRLTLPEPPSANRYWRVWHGHPVKSVEAHEYTDAVTAALLKQIAHADRQQLPVTGPIGIALAWHRSAKRGDLDNRAKVALDALQGLLYVDDQQVVALVMTRHESPRRGRLEVEVWRVENVETVQATLCL